MKAVVKETLTKADIKDKGVIYVTPESFNSVNWVGVEVTGSKYYVDKAVERGAIAVEVDKPKAENKSTEKPKRKVKTKEDEPSD